MRAGQQVSVGKLIVNLLEEGPQQHTHAITFLPNSISEWLDFFSLDFFSGCHEALLHCCKLDLASNLSLFGMLRHWSTILSPALAQCASEPGVKLLLERQLAALSAHLAGLCNATAAPCT